MSNILDTATPLTALAALVAAGGANGLAAAGYQAQLTALAGPYVTAYGASGGPCDVAKGNWMTAALTAWNAAVSACAYVDSGAGTMAINDYDASALLARIAACLALPSMQPGGAHAGMAPDLTAHQTFVSGLWQPTQGTWAFTTPVTSPTSYIASYSGPGAGPFTLADAVILPPGFAGYGGVSASSDPYLGSAPVPYVYPTVPSGYPSNVTLAPSGVSYTGQITPSVRSMEIVAPPQQPSGPPTYSLATLLGLISDFLAGA